ncbi:MAG: arsenic resistance N-acetyltransferase ArsN2 [Bacteroidota bacterium]
MPRPSRPFLIRPAAQTDLDTLHALLAEASLPVAGVDEHYRTFLVAERDGELVGAIGVELYGETALLRSAVVAPAWRNAGIGSALFAQIVALARKHAVRRLILLTETAEEYFRRKGFRTIDAATVTGPVTGSVEFTGACPSHAACMELTL